MANKSRYRDSAMCTLTSMIQVRYVNPEYAIYLQGNRVQGK
jgi:hypothetical protein